MCTLFGRRFEPDLIDLKQYEADLLSGLARGWEPKPPPTTVHRLGGWTEAELVEIRKNRAEAIAIYERIKADVRLLHSHGY